MEFEMKSLVVVLSVLAIFGHGNGVYAENGRSGSCDFPAIFNFGDSNSDTGTASAAFKSNTWPYGMSGTNKRASDGRLIIDFLAENLGLPHLNSSEDLNGTSFKHGANFACGGQRIIPDQAAPPANFSYHLDKQVSLFLEFKSRAIADQSGKNCIYPDNSVFSKALYTIDIGQNDIAAQFGFKDIPIVLDFYTNSVQRLLKDGAKYMWVHNTGPFGCMPQTIEWNCTGTKKKCTRDEHGCIIEFNKDAQNFNAELKNRINQLRHQYPDAVITLVDMYSVKHHLITEMKGFADPLKYCCGNKAVACGNTIVNKDDGKSLFGYPCKDLSKYISWDGTHYSEAANRVVAKLIVDGSYSEPRVPISQACMKQPK